MSIFHPHKDLTPILQIPADWKHRGFYPDFTDRYERGDDWRSLANWIHDHMPYSELEVFPSLCAFNISWHEKPTKAIYSFIASKGYLLRESNVPSGRRELYADFPRLWNE